MAKRWFLFLVVVVFFQACQRRRGIEEEHDSEGFLVLLAVQIHSSKLAKRQHKFPVAIRLAKGKKLTFGPLYLRSLYARLDECD